MQAAATIWGAVGWWGMYGLGARYMQPVGHSLLNLPNIRDQVAVEVGLDYLRESYGYLALGNYSWSEVLPVVGGMWQFWINPNLALYPKLDFGYAFGWFSGFTYCNGIPDCKEPTYGGFFFNVSALWSQIHAKVMHRAAATTGTSLSSGARMPAPGILLLTILTMVFFAGNSLLCRAALRHTGLDPASFTAIRILSAALTTWAIVRLRSGPARPIFKPPPTFPFLESQCQRAPPEAKIHFRFRRNTARKTEPSGRRGRGV